MFYHRPMKLLIQVEDSLLGQVASYWEYYGKPCRLLLRPAKAENLTAIALDMDNPDAGSFVWALVERLHVRLYNADTRQAVKAEEVFMY